MSSAAAQALLDWGLGAGGLAPKGLWGLAAAPNAGALWLVPDAPGLPKVIGAAWDPNGPAGFPKAVAG